MTSTLERTFAFYWRALADDLPEPEREYRFAPPRRWRLDYAWPAHLVAVELQGGTWVRGRHSRGRGQSQDYEKHNAATLLGWKLLYFTSDMLTADPHAVVEDVRALLAA